MANDTLPVVASGGKALLMDLAARCESALHPSGLLNCVIFATAERDKWSNPSDADLYARLDWTRNRADWVWLRDHGMRNYTASPSDARSLVPPDWHLSLQGVNDTWHVLLNQTASGTTGRVSALGCTPELALCAAALRARAALL